MKVIINRMKKLHTAILCTLLFFGGYALLADSDFATEVVDHSADLDGSGIYNDPQAVLGQPATWNSDTHAVSMVAPAWDKDENGKKVITTIGADSYIVVKFDHRVEDDPDNLYGVDFIVFGNSYYSGPDTVAADTNMESYYITGNAFSEPIRIAVSQDGVNWYEYSNGPFGDTGYPTQALAWNRASHLWGEILDFTKPVDPNEYPFTNSVPHSDGNYYVADIIDYAFRGSAGGTGFNLAESGFSWIQYVKIYGDSSYANGEIDAIADAAPFYNLDLTVKMPDESGTLKISPGPPVYTPNSEADLTEGAYSLCYKKNTLVTLTAAPEPGWQCVWSGAVNGTDNQITLTIAAAKNLTVEFSAVGDQDLSAVRMNVVAGKLTNTTPAMEYQLNNGSWHDCTGPDTDVTFIEGDVVVREKAEPANIRTVGHVIKPPIPAYTVNYTSESTAENVTVSDIYSTASDMSAASAGTGSPVTLTPGTDIYFQTPATTIALQSEIEHLVVPPRPPVPSVSVDNDNIVTAILISATTAMEYKLDGADYRDVTTGLEDGTETLNLLGPHTLFVRIKATESSFASNPAGDLDENNTAPPGDEPDNRYSAQMYNGNSFSYTVNPDKIAERWHFDPASDGALPPSGFLRSSRPSLSGDGSAVCVFAADSSDNTGHIVALDAFYGTKLWSLQVASCNAYDSWSSPVCSGNFVYWAGSDGSGNTFVYKINSKTGSVSEQEGGWMVKLPDSVEIVNASPTVNAKKVFISSFSGTHYALDIGDGSVKWSNSDGGTGQTSFAYDAARNLLYQVIFDGAYRIRAYGADSGVPVWTSDWSFTYAPRSCSVTYNSDKIYVQDYNFSGDGRLYVADAASSGALLLNQPTPASGDSAPAVDSDGNIFVFGDFNGAGQCRGYTADGTISWTSSLGGGWNGSPAVSGDYVFAGQQNGNTLYILRKSDGTKAASVPGSGPVSFGERTFYTVGSDGIIYAYAASNDFADSVVSYDASGADSFTNPTSALNRPAVDTVGDGIAISASEPVPVVNVYPAHQNSELVTVAAGSNGLILEFDHPVRNSRDNKYGIDFIIFGDAAQEVEGGGTWDNRDPDAVNGDSSLSKGAATVSVSEDGITWHTFSGGPYADDFAPSFGRVYDDVNPYRPDAAWDWNLWWGSETDPTLPVNPIWEPANFAGKSVKEVSILYGKAAGGTGFDIASLGLDSVRYVKIVSTGTDADIDAVADARIAGDSTAPSAVSGFSASLSGRNVAMSWTPPSDSDYSKVIIVRSASSSPSSLSPVNGVSYYPYYNSSYGDSTVVFSGDETAFTDLNLPAGDYTYRIYAADTMLNYSEPQESAISIEPAVFAVSFITDGTQGAFFFGSTAQSVTEGGDASAVTAVAPEGYNFTNWSSPDGFSSSENPLTVTGVTADMTLTANFAIQTFTLKYTASSGGSISGETLQSVAYGSDGTSVEAVPGPGYHFTSWSDGMTTAVRRDRRILSDVSVTANFAEDAAPTYSLTVKSGSGSGTFEEGAFVAIIADSPPEHYSFTHWSSYGGGSFGDSSSPHTVFTMPASDITVIANFAIDTFTVSYSANPGGTISGTALQIIEYGSDADQVEALPDTGYHFVSWSDGLETPERRETAVTGDIAVTASFAKNRYSLSYRAGEHGSISGPADQTLFYGEDGREVTAVPEDGYLFDRWSDGYPYKKRKDLNISSDISTTALFIPAPKKITVGSLITLTTEDLTPFSEDFVRRPKIYGWYINPLSNRVVKTHLKAVTKITPSTPSDTFSSVWKKRVTLYNSRALRKALRNGITTEEWISINPIEPLRCRLTVQLKNSDGAIVLHDFKNVLIAPPSVTSVTKQDGEISVDSATTGSILAIKGHYFGYKRPSVSLEYITAGKIIRKRLKVLKEYTHSDYRGRENSSCMDPETGESTLLVKLSDSGFPPGEYTVILDNRVGIALDEETGLLPKITIPE